jgi:hypothetical protein
VELRFASAEPLPGRERRLIRGYGSIPVAPWDLHHHHTVMQQTPRASTPTEVLAGLVERVTFHNEENGFCVLRVKARGQRDLITVLGHAAMIAAGEFIQASGIWINDRTHGVQFRASFLKATPPTTTEGIEKYLGSGMIRGIGPAQPATMRSARFRPIPVTSRRRLGSCSMMSKTASLKARTSFRA